MTFCGHFHTLASLENPLTTACSVSSLPLLRAPHRLKTAASATAPSSLTLQSPVPHHLREEKQMQASYISVSWRSEDNSLGTAVKWFPSRYLKERCRVIAPGRVLHARHTTRSLYESPPPPPNICHPCVILRSLSR